MKQLSLAFAALLTASVCSAAPCAGSDTKLEANQRTSFARAAERHLRSRLPHEVAVQVKVRPEEIISYRSFGGWVILRVETHATDSPYLFYSTAPDEADSYVSLWAGASSRIGSHEIQTWVLNNVPGASRELAACFSWAVTHHPT